MSGDLIFSAPLRATGSWDLEFGIGVGNALPVNVHASGSLPGLKGQVRLAISIGVQAMGALPGVTGAVAIHYDNSVLRSPVGLGRAGWREGAEAAGLSANAWRDARRWARRSGQSVVDSIQLQGAAAAGYKDFSRNSIARAPAWQDDSLLDGQARTDWLQRTRQAIVGSAPWQDGRPLAIIGKDLWRDRLRHLRPVVAGGWRDGALAGKPVLMPLADGWSIGILQGGCWVDGHTPAPGRYRPAPPITPPGESPNGLHSDLLFANFLQTSGPWGLLFGAGSVPGQITIPSRRTYLVFNQISLLRVDGGQDMRPLSLSIFIDKDSWVWGWNGTFHGSCLDLLLSDNPLDPVELEVTVNGVVWRLLAESVNRDDSFATSRVTVSGKGTAGLLAEPYAAPSSRTNTASATAQQCLVAALAINGASLGWSVDWQITDWLIPAGIWTHTGTHAEAATRIAGAAGGYIQAHRSGRSFAVLPSYPVLPWYWDSVTPDFILPSAVTTKVGVQYRNQPDYNRVYVSGEGAGVLGDVKRAGTAGDFPAPMVVDALVTHTDAARQRGSAILGASGPGQLLSLA